MEGPGKKRQIKSKKRRNFRMGMRVVKRKLWRNGLQPTESGKKAVGVLLVNER